MVAKDAKIQQNWAPMHQLWFGLSWNFLASSGALYQIKYYPIIIRQILSKYYPIIIRQINSNKLRFARLAVCRLFCRKLQNLVRNRSEWDHDSWCWLWWWWCWFHNLIKVLQSLISKVSPSGNAQLAMSNSQDHSFSRYNLLYNSVQCSPLYCTE